MLKFVTSCLIALTTVALATCGEDADSPESKSIADIAEAVASANTETTSYHYAMDVTLADSFNGEAREFASSVVGDFQAPDRRQEQVSITLSGFTIVLDRIDVGTDSYARELPDGRWKTGSAAVQGALGSPAAYSAFVELGLPSGEVLGVAELDGEPVFHIKISVPEALGSASAEAELWIATDDMLLRRIVIAEEIPIEAGPDAPASQITSFSSTLVFSDYGKPVSIQAPVIP